ncbi:MAG: hypothetical protein WCW16_04955 [Candidatus Magasanikbacteria bacterium]
MQLDPRQLTPQQKEMLLKDENGNDIPDIMEQGVTLDEIGISTGLPQDASNLEKSRKQMKFLGKFVKVSMLKRLFTIPETPEQGQQLARENNKALFRMFWPWFVVIDFFVMAIIFYFVFKK